MHHPFISFLFISRFTEANILNLFFFFVLFSAVRDHFKRIESEISCKKPRPRIINISADATKTYMPHCTVLHRCGDETGCCQSDALTCTVKQEERVELFFSVSTFYCKSPGKKKQQTHRHLLHTKRTSQYREHKFILFSRRDDLLCTHQIDQCCVLHTRTQRERQIESDI